MEQQTIKTINPRNTKTNENKLNTQNQKITNNQRNCIEIQHH